MTTMDDNSTPESNVNSTINAVAGLVKEIPIYQDTVQPAAKEVGKSLHTVAKTINIALAPIKILVWGYEKIEEFISKRVSEKLENIAAEDIVTPDPKIAVPAIEALRYTGHDENLRELYANLLANSMDRNTIREAHPGFVEILKNLSSDEAIFLRAFIEKDIFPLIDIQRELNDNKGYIPYINHFSTFYQNIGINCIDLVPSYIDNLVRLGILEIPSGLSLTRENTYEPLENSPELIQAKSIIQDIYKEKIHFERKIVRRTSFGTQFIMSVVKDK